MSFVKETSMVIYQDDESKKGMNIGKMHIAGKRLDRMPN